jgi:predicted RNA-binding protein with PIN domain
MAIVYWFRFRVARFNFESETLRVHYIVDGYSVIHARPELRKSLQVRLSHARDLLVRLLQDFQDQTGDRVTVVFDGRGDHAKPGAKKKKNAKDNRDVEIVFSGKGQSADMVIERLVGKSDSPQRLIAVTADRAIENTVGALGASSISPDSFVELARESQIDFSDWLSDHRWKIKRKFSRG